MKKKLPDSVCGDRRYTLIESFQSVFGNDFVPDTVESSIKWSKSDPLQIIDQADFKWDTKKHTHCPVQDTSKIKSKSINTPATSSCINLPSSVKVQGRIFTPMKPSIKRKGRVSDTGMTYSDDKLQLKQNPHTIMTSQVTSTSLESIIPQGCHWYNNSCAYDAVIFILYNIWASDIDYFSVKFGELSSEWLGLMSDSFKKNIHKQYTLEQIRDYIRRRLCNVYPDYFKFGANASVEGIFSKIFTGSVVFNKAYCTCPKGHQSHMIESYNCSFYLGGTGELHWTTIQDLFNICNNRPVSQECNVCGCSMKKIDMFMYAPV